MKAVVIAAGLGNRLGDLTRDRPKALVQLDGRELIHRVMDFLDAGDFTQRIVVTGYGSEIFSRFLRDHYPEVMVIQNPDYKKGSVKTIERALPHLDEEFLLMNVDHVYPRRMLSSILRARNGLMAICDFDRELGHDDMKIKLDDNGRLKFINKRLDKFDGGYIGMTFCGSDNLDEYRRAVPKTLTAHGENANVEAIIGTLAADGVPVNVFDASKIGWLEIDTQADLTRATKVLRDNPDFLA